jgi:4-diphosphocytidyl-2-C-methyl-D-erythritol kinase
VSVGDTTERFGVVSMDAPAKLTLSLRITGVRDDGYHLIDAEMVTLDFGDRIEIIADGAPRGRVVVAEQGETRIAESDDLVVRALEAVGADPSVVVHKSIPRGAGLGGGSADAAAVLRWAGVTDPAVAVSLGADVPFCVVGGRARVRGIGELVEPLLFIEDEVTLLTPPVRCSTPLVYRMWDDLGGPMGDHGNDLEPAALVLVPELAEWRDELAAVSGDRPRLAGSGSTWWVPGSFPGDGRIVACTVR